MKKKTKVFLGAYINYMNAQNINCRSIANHLDKSKYEVRTLILSESRFMKLNDVQTIKVFNNRFSIFFAFLKGLIWSDVSYLPKHQSTPRFALKISKILKTKIFTTIEGNMCDTRKRSMIDSFNGVDNMRKYFSLIPNIYGITKHIVNNATCGIKLNNNPLYLGVEKDNFTPHKKKKIQNIVFIGSLIRRKNIEDFFEIARIFPDLSFHVIGNKKYVRISKKKVKFKNVFTKKYYNKESLDLHDNIVFHGRLNHKDMSEKLNEMDLLFLPSRSEGFPKVILEAAASAIPSILYNDYGADEWINNGINGFVVSEFKEVVSIIKRLIENNDLMINVSEGSLSLSEVYDWKIIIKNWEKVIDNLK